MLLTEQEAGELWRKPENYGKPLAYAKAIEIAVIEKLKAQGVAAWLSIDSIGERYLCFSKLYTLHEGD